MISCLYLFVRLVVSSCPTSVRMAKKKTGAAANGRADKAEPEPPKEKTRKNNQRGGTASPAPWGEPPDGADLLDDLLGDDQDQNNASDTVKKGETNGDPDTNAGAGGEDPTTTTSATADPVQTGASSLFASADLGDTGNSVSGQLVLMFASLTQRHLCLLFPVILKWCRRREP